MIDIYINEKPLWVPDDVSVTLEQTHNGVDVDNMMADIVWTFDIPATAENNRLLDHANHVIFGGKKKYECWVRFNGVQISKGSLYIQRANEKTISLGLTLNTPLPTWSKQMLNENNYGDDIVISEDNDNHKNGWLKFLKDSLDKDSVYKFFLMAATGFCKNNDYWGKFNDKLSPLANSNDQNIFRSYLNRLLFSSGGETIYNNADTDQQGVRIFNANLGTGSNHNGYAFCPAIRLDWLVRKVFGNADLEVVGNFLSDPKIKRLFVQSLNMMDGTLEQYGNDQYIKLTPVNESPSYSDEATTPLVPFTVGENTQHYAFYTMTGGEGYEFALSYRLRLNQDNLQHGTLSQSLMKRYDEVYMIGIVKKDTSVSDFPNCRGCALSIGGKVTSQSKWTYGRIPSYDYLDVRLPQGSGSLNVTNINMSNEGKAYVTYKRGMVSQSYTNLITYIHESNGWWSQLTPSTSFGGANNTVGDNTMEGAFRIALGTLGAGQKYQLVLAKCRVETTNTSGERYVASDSTDSANFGILAYGSFETIPDSSWSLVDTYELSTQETPLNIFTNIMKWSDHVPNMSNSEFVKAIASYFGINVFIDNFGNKVELSFFKDIMNAKSISIDDYVVDEQVEREQYEPKQYEIAMETTKQQHEVNENVILPEVPTRDELPLIDRSINKYVFVENENVYRRGDNESDTTGEDINSTYSWARAAGNDHKLTIGEEQEVDPTDVKPAVSIPAMRWVDTIGVKPDKYLSCLDTQGNSPVMDTDYTGEFPLIINQYKGHKNILLDSGTATHRTAYIEFANPTDMDEYGNHNTSYLSLTPTGENSVGETYLRPKYEFLADKVDVVLSAVVPTAVFMQLYKLMMPQSEVPANQTRWLMYRNQRYLPTKINYTFGKGDEVTCEIQASRKR